MHTLVLAAADTPAVEFEPGWNAAAWVFWWGFVIMAGFLGVIIPWWISQGGSVLWGLAALGSYFFLFGFAYPAMARHAPGSVAGWIFGAFLLAALLSWASLALSSNSRSWLPHLIGGMSTVSVVFNGIGEAATRSAAQAQMSTGDYIGGVIGLALIIGLVLFARWRE